jgi:hypothetical protein
MDERHFQEAAEVLGRFIEAGEDAARFFEPADEAFDDVAPLVRTAVELHRPSGASVGFPGGDDRSDAQREQVFVDPLRAIPFVAAQLHGPSDLPTAAVAQDIVGSDEQRVERRGFVLLSGRQMEVQGMAGGVAEQMDFGRKSAARPT